MALKKALPGRQLGSFRESFIFVECFYIVKKQKNIEGNTKLFKKESESERDKHCWSGGAPWTLFMLTETLWILITETFQQIMCQGLPLGCLQCLLVCTVLDKNFVCSARFYVFYWNVKWFWFLLQCLSVQIFISPNFGRIVGVPKVWCMFILLQTVLFLTDSVFDA